MSSFEYTGRTAVDIGRRLQITRAAKELTQENLSAIVGISQHGYSQYETGKRRITLNVANRMCDELNITLDWIYRGDISSLPHNLHSRIFSAA